LPGSFGAEFFFVAIVLDSLSVVKD